MFRLSTLLTITLTAPLVVAALVTPEDAAFAGSVLTKTEQKAFRAEVEAAYPDTVWALKDLPARSGYAMMASYLSPIAEVRPDGFTIDATEVARGTVVGAETVWFGVRPYDTLELKEVVFDDDFCVIAFVGVGASAGRDTKIKLFARSLGEVKQGLDQLVSTADPIQADWPAPIQQAIHNRTVINGMSKRQAYLVVGEPTSVSVNDIAGKKVETWITRQTEGMRIGVGAAVSVTGYPPTFRFEDGVVVGLATAPGGGVNLDE